MTPLMVAAGLLLQQPGPTRLPDAKGGERPVYRSLKPGEQRNEGLLRRITCPGRGPVVFFVTTKATKDAKETKETVQYTAPQLTSVDFIVYRKDFRGPVTCEGFGAGEPVYVTWKPDGKARRVIAVEFLPK